ncbi:MAG TPA: ABC transporter permease [Terriglobales bacterium]
MGTIFQDLRYSLRLLAKSPGFTLIAVITLALGIGANTAIFTLSYALLLRSLPVPEPDRLVHVSYSKVGIDYGISGPLFESVKRHQQVFDGVFAWSSQPLEWNDGSESRKLHGALASGDTFSTLQVKPALGRFFLDADDQPGGGPNGWAAVISYAFWRDHFQSDPSVLGRTLRIEQLPVTIVGVMPKGFEGVEVGAATQMILPLSIEPQIHGKQARLHEEGALVFQMMGRLKPGLKQSQAEAEMRRIEPQVLAEADTKHILARFFSGLRLATSSGRNGFAWVRKQYSEPLLLIQILVGLILLICCTNLATLLSARASTRRHEIAVRNALGARRSQVIRQLLVENALLSIAGAALGLLFARPASQGLLSALVTRQTLQLDLSPNLMVLVFTTALTVLTVLLGGLLPALRATRVNVVTDLKESSSSLHGAGSNAERWLLPLQVGLSMVLLIGAGLFSATLHKLLNTPTGFSTNGIVIVPTDFQRLKLSDEEKAGLYQRILERLNSSPGIERASAESIPMLREFRSSIRVSPMTSGEHSDAVQTMFYNNVGVNYFATVGTRLLLGRDFSSQDKNAGHLVCILNRSAAEVLFPNQDPVGRTVRVGGDKPADFEVVGMVEDTKYTNLRTEAPRTFYATFLEDPEHANTSSMYLVLRTPNAAAAIAAVRQALKELAPEAPMLDADTMDQEVRTSVGREIVIATLATFFAAPALLLTAIGLYGLLAYSVSRRTSEIGVRMALGAKRSDVITMILREAFVPVTLGLAGGAVLALGATRYIKSLLYGVNQHDAVIYAGAAGIMLLVALLAAWLPAHRAAATDQMVALRYE